MPEHLRLFLDQMLRIEVAEALRNDGHNVMRTSDVGQARADDYQVLLEAINENRILITLDEHFGNWAVLPLRSHPGVIRLKINPTTSTNAINLLVPFLRLYSQKEIKNHLVILSTLRSRWIHTA